MASLSFHLWADRQDVACPGEAPGPEGVKQWPDQGPRPLASGRLNIVHVESALLSTGGLLNKGPVVSTLGSRDEGHEGHHWGWRGWPGLGW